MSREASGAAADPLDGEALYADVKMYAGLGEHRTGSEGDELTTRWLAQSLRAAGYAAEMQSFDYPVFEIGESLLEVGERRIAGFPAWTPRTTAPEGLTAPLGRKPAAGRILVISLPYSPNASLELAAYRDPLVGAAASGAAAVVAVTESPVGQVIALNAEPKAQPWPVPVLLVAGAEGPALLKAAKAGETATLRLTGAERARPVANVIARRAGAGPTLVMTTPKSGWMRCAGERGAGVALWLGLARWLARETKADLVLAATTAHEFHGYGGHRFAEELAPKPERVGFWLHIGANVAAYDVALVEGRIRLSDGPTRARGIACSPAVIEAAKAAFAGQPGYQTPLDIEANRAPGEVAVFRSFGYQPIAGLVGAHPLHHTPRDLPDVTGPEVLLPVARGLQTLLRSVLKQS